MSFRESEVYLDEGSSFSGRTAVSKTANLGSNPSDPATSSQ